MTTTWTDLKAEAEHERRSAAKLYRWARRYEQQTYGDPAKNAERAAQNREWARNAAARARRYEQMAAQ
jgi:hypothetical protein